jgi:hypothetical protein
MRLNEREPRLEENCRVSVNSEASQDGFKPQHFHALQQHIFASTGLKEIKAQAVSRIKSIWLNNSNGQNSDAHSPSRSLGERRSNDASSPSRSFYSVRAFHSTPRRNRPSKIPASQGFPRTSGFLGERCSSKVIRISNRYCQKGCVLEVRPGGEHSRKAGIFTYSRNFDKREGENTRKASTYSITPLNVAQFACETSQNAQKTSRL